MVNANSVANTTFLDTPRVVLGCMYAVGVQKITRFKTVGLNARRQRDLHHRFAVPAQYSLECTRTV